jgi:hypothetical protein
MLMQDIQHITLTPKNIDSDSINFVMYDEVNITSDPKLILLQLVMKLLLTTPGTDSFFPTAGAGFQQLVKKMPRNDRDAGEITVQVTTGIDDVDTQIRAYQSRTPSIPNAGRLRALRLSRGKTVAIIESTGTLIVPIDIVTYDGVTTQINAPFLSSGGSS